MKDIALPISKETIAQSDPAAIARDIPRVYFPNFDGIRFCAALMVMLQHLSNYKSDYSPVLGNAERNLVAFAGFHGVTLFFVLSGFLIFYLLFVEKAQTGTVSISSFYKRRMLRIWPLYFGFGLISILGVSTVLQWFNTSVESHTGENLFWLSIFAINLQLIFGTVNRGIVELYWSVCIEEQFYLFAPWLIKKGERMLGIALLLIVIGITSSFVVHELAATKAAGMNSEFNPVYLFTTCWFHAFGFGMLAAYLMFNKSVFNRIRPVVENKWIQAVVVVITLLYITNLIPRPQFITDYLFSTVTAILFAFIILAAASGRFLFNLETKFFRTMGKYSFGMYVLHATIMQLFLWLCVRFVPQDQDWFYELVYPLLAILLVAVAAGLSYEFFEKRFLKLKQRFTIVRNKNV